MKIPGSIRNLYAEQNEVFSSLKTRVDALMKPRLHHQWHYESRVKAEESFTLKIESGSVPNPRTLEDFFAATIVVRNSTEIAGAEAMVRDAFDFVDRKPVTDDRTPFRPSEFMFDDLRLYMRWRDDSTMPATGLAGTLFEIQIKTFLQHAWSIATHDLTYKTDEVSWGKSRIAYQIKAMLEHAEVSIEQASSLGRNSAVLRKVDAHTEALQPFMALMTELWAAEDLPSDVQRLALNVAGLARLVGLSAVDLKTLLELEQAEGRGPAFRNLSPYGAVIQTLVTRRLDDFTAALEKKQQYPALLTREIEFPEGFDLEAFKAGAILVI